MAETAETPTKDPWLSAWPDVSADGLVVSDRLIRALEAHASAEAQDMADCMSIVEQSDDPVARLLMSMIIDDEQRHHALLESMVRRLRDEAALDTPGPLSRSDPALCTALRALMRDEHEGARHLRHIARQESQIYGSLFSLLLETIARDSEKHATILRFLLTRSEKHAS